MSHRERSGPSRAVWAGVLAVSVAALAVGGYSVSSADEDVATVGSISVTPEASADATRTEKNQAPATAPEVGRSSADLANQSAPSVVAPTRVSVPALDIDAPIDALGVEGDQMAVPADGDRVGWYKFGATPATDGGSTVLAGHVDTSAGFGAMAPLRQAEVGTLIDVELADGNTRTYEVVGREQFDKGDLPVADLFERAGSERLVLITCSGEWQADVGSYTDNVVVAATPVLDE
ncbi:class F sortase [Ornithinimicrobium sp. Arc0846-15]|nr:class F sortase [Ornithinimicrobium laminariae]